MGEPTDDDTESFDAFFRQSSRSLVAYGYVLTGDQSAAQDLAQEALLRAWSRWPRVRRLDDSLAWTRRALHNLAVSKARYDNVRRRPTDQPRIVPPPDSDHLELAKVLRALPTNQAMALVLHDGAGASVHDIARQLQVPEGTVKAWLSRGRTAAAAGLRPVMEPAKERNVIR